MTQLLCSVYGPLVLPGDLHNLALALHMERFQTIVPAKKCSYSTLRTIHFFGLTLAYRTSVDILKIIRVTASLPPTNARETWTKNMHVGQFLVPVFL